MNGKSHHNRKYRDVIYRVLAMAVVLDPRYNRLYLKYSLNRIYGDGANEQLKKVLDLCQELYDEYKCRATLLTSGSSVSIERQGESFVDSTPLGSGRFVKRTRFSDDWESYRDVEEADDNISELDLYYREKTIK